MKPMPVSDIDVAFPVSVQHLMPEYDAIPDEFKRFNNPFARIASEWFFGGMSKKTADRLYAKDGIDTKDAVRHLRCILGSFEPKHEHKEAAVAYLLSLWFELR